MARRFPAVMKRLMIGGVRLQLGPDFDVATHFTPRYNPWEQRVCVARNGNFFRAIKSGDVSVVTDRVRNFSRNGIMLESGRELEADVIVTATGLDLKAVGGLDIFVDGRRVEIANSLQYKGAMFSGIPNLASCFGYINASWTLKADLVSEYVCRLVSHMDATGLRQCTPELNDPSIALEPFLDFSSGYITRSINQFAKQGSRRPWKLYQNYALDVATLRFGKLDDGTLVFSNPAPISESLL
jgi:cation diffusion facilitator CzcD-associated flavoprotein CzcO